MNYSNKFDIQDVLMKLGNLNFSKIFNKLKYLLICYVTGKSIGNYKLHRQYKPKNIKMIKLPPELKIKHTDFKMCEISSKSLEHYIRNFISVVLDNIPKNDLIIFLNNLSTLQVASSDHILVNLFFNLVLGNNSVGFYDPKNNNILVNEDSCSVAIYHELFHMASSVFKDEISYSGFRQSSIKDKNMDLGVGINEGYTELMARRYFRSNVKVSLAYEREVEIARRLEEIVGKDKMQSLYLNANLPGLIEELKQYSTEEEIMKFISSTDFVCKNLSNKKTKMVKKIMLIDSLNYVNKFLIKAYTTKMLQQFEENDLTEEIKRYVHSLNSYITIGNEECKILSNDDIIECFESIYKNMNSSKIEKSSVSIKK